MLVSIALSTSGYAATLPTEGYSMRVWQTEDGLPQNMVTSTVQTHDGYLWFGTYGGLARFDGERFQIYEPANTPTLRDRRISCLFVDPQGTLWIGHESGIITRYRDGRFEPVTLSSPAAAEKVLGLGNDEQGRLWAMRAKGTFEAVDESARLPSLIAPNLPGDMAWTRSSRGSIWVAENGQAAHLTNGKLISASFQPTPQTSYVMGIAAAADGGAWIICDNRIRKWAGDHWTEDRGDYPWAPGPLSYSLELRDGTLAVGTIYSGLYLVFRDGRRAVHFDRSNGLPQNWVRSLYEDREGSLWIGAGSAGVVSIHTTAFSVLNSPDHWQGCTVLSVAPGRERALWIGTDGAGLYHYSAGTWTHYGEAEGLGNLYIPAVTETQGGAVWTGAFWWGGPYRLDNGHFARPEQVDAMSSPVFGLLASPGADELLVGNRDGLLRLTGDRSTWLVKAPDGFAGAACALARDRTGAVWCGFEEGGLARIANGEVSTFHRKDGIASDSVQCLLSDDDGSLWIGTADNGLSRFKNGRFANLGVTQGLVDNAICYILDDGLGSLWLSTHHGIQRVAKDDLNRCADGVTSAFPGHTYDHNDGLPTVEFTGGLQAAGCRTSDGRLWFASSHGILCVDPAQIEPNPTPPPVVLESLFVDGEAKGFSHGSVPALLQPDHQRLEFRFAALSFVAPSKILFKYRLNGIDKAWVDAGTKRTAFYSHLPAGSYRFRVIACNNDGVWNSEGASLAFTVAPYFWETWWFLSFAALVTLSGVALFARQLTRRRMQRRMEHLERQHAIERERARIAQDIHDDIGTSLTRIAMFSQPDRNDLDQPKQTAAVLSRIYSTTREMTRALDEIVWAIDPRQDTLDGLVCYMGRFAQDLLDTANIRCRLDLPIDLPDWRLTAETRHNLFLAFKEALNNTIKHAAATEVHISMQPNSDTFVLVVKDNGRGFDCSHRGSTESGRIASGNGLPSLVRRLSRIGGRCEISSEPGSGTTVSFIVNVPDRARTSESSPPDPAHPFPPPSS